jgi:hypothetical protein
MRDIIQDVESSKLWKSLIDDLIYNMDDRSEYIQHHYQDRSSEIDDGTSNSSVRGGVLLRFPVILHAVLDAVERDGYSEVISWQPHGRCFVIHKPKIFVSSIMQKYFKQTKMTSFQRQLNLYGFQRLTRGEDKGGYYHEFFLRGKAFLAHRIHRIRIKGTGCRKKSNPVSEPDFSKMPPIQSIFPHDFSEHLLSSSFPNDLSSSFPNDQLERECNVNENHEYLRAEASNISLYSSPGKDERVELLEEMKYNAQIFVDNLLIDPFDFDGYGELSNMSGSSNVVFDIPENFGDENDFSDLMMNLIRL